MIAKFEPKNIRLSASGANRWSRCPGSAWLEADLPDVPSPWAALGSAVHAVGEWAILNDVNLDPSVLGDKIGYQIGPRGFIEKIVAKPGAPAGLPKIVYETNADGWLSSKDIGDTDIYATTVRNIAKKWGVKPQMESSISWNGTKGRVDVIFDDRPARVAILDYKNGWGAVPATDNLQMTIYLAGFLKLDRGYNELPGRMTAGIIQPNGADGQTLKVWHVGRGRLVELHEELSAAAGLARDMAAGLAPLEFFPGAAQCQWCKAKSICPALKEQALATIPAVSPKKAPPPPQALSPAEMGEVLNNWPLVKNWMAAVEEEVTARLSRDEPVPGWKLVEGESRRRVFDPDGLMAAAAENNWDVTERKIKPFGQLDKIVPKSVLARFTDKPVGKPTLAPETDKRPAINTTGELMKGF